MAVIKINSFGGEYPSVSSRALPPGAARTSLDLLATTNEFYPMLAEAHVFTSPVNNPKTIYRSTHNSAGGYVADLTLGWLADPNIVSTAKWPSGDNVSERMTLTAENGVLPPHVYDNAPLVKKLGVPAPTAPTAVVTVGNEYTVDEDTAARLRIPMDMSNAVSASGVRDTIGMTGLAAPSLSAGGFVSHTAAVRPSPTVTLAEGDYAFMVPMDAAGNVLLFPATDGYLLATEFGGKKVTYYGNNYWAVNVTVNGFGWTANTSLLTTQVQAIQHPDPNVVRTVGANFANTRQLFANSDIASFASQMNDRFSRLNPEVSQSVNALDVASTALVKAANDYSNQTALAATITAFYSKAAVALEITNAVSDFATTLYDAEHDLRYATPAATLTTKATFIADANANISFATDGTKVLNKEALRATVKTRMTTAMSGNAEFIGQLDGIIIAALDRLAAVIDVNHWSARADWPSSKSVTDAANGARATNVYNALLAVRSAAQRVTADYTLLVQKTAKYLADVAESLFSTDGGLGTPTIRVVEDRFYVCTYVTSWGEESAPSLPTDLLAVDQNDSVVVTRTGTVPVDRGVISSWRLYRTNSGSKATDYQFVAEVPTASATYTDTLKGAELGEVIPSLTWLEPPANLQGITNMANGVQAGYFGTTLCFCEPYVPYAWPFEYRLPLKSPIVGIAAFGQNLFVGTHGAPYIVSGADSASMSTLELVGGQPCVSLRSIVAVENGAIYASPDGLCLATAGGVELLTQGLVTREQWQSIPSPEAAMAAIHDNVYYLLTGVAPNQICYALDFTAKKLTRVRATGSALYSDKVTDTLCIASGTSIKAMFSTSRRTGLYRTGIYNTGAHRPFAWLQVDSTFILEGTASTPASVTVRWYGDGVLRHTAVVTNATPVRLPAGRYLEHEIEIESQTRITSVTLAGSTQELQTV